MMENYFYAKGITDYTVKVNTASIFLLILCFYGGEAGPQIKGIVRLGRGKSSNVN
ncbi:hypothetical protein Goari_023493 [Gossypium aridum]|uniref:Uncharacterized protein n=1 Tax=Gossypium aridum TaxID=34290 RepID=A0A7J8X3M6_GOSAI|nr:hypothetical protein [Gossypium aridum]